MKVLLYCPIYRLEQETLDSIMRLESGGHDLDIHFARTEPVSRPSINILRTYQHGRAMFLAGDWDALMTVESDMIVPPDALQRLAIMDADIALALYVHRHYVPGRRCFWSAQYFGPDTTEPDTWLNWLEGEAEKAWGQIIRTSGGGLGCAFIHRHVLERIDFRLVFSGRRLLADCDMWFYHDAIKAGFVIKTDCSLHCGHKQPNRLILWPAEPPQYLSIVESTYPPSPYHHEVLNGTAHA